MIRPRRFPILVLCAAAVACVNPHEPDPPAQQVEVWVTTPNAYDQALLIAFNRPVRGLEAAPGVRRFADSDARAGAVLIIASDPLPTGDVRVASFRTADAAELEGIEAAVIDVARSDFTTREDLRGYAVRLVSR